MTIERNTEGLKQNAQKKREQSFKKVEQGIQKLLRDKEPINFNTVAKASGLSKAWLYKEPEIKSRIEFLRESHSESKKIPVKERASDSSKDTIIKTLKERIKKLEAENKGLREQHEVIYGRVIYVSDLERKVERLEAENSKLKNELNSLQIHSIDQPTSNSTGVKSASKQSTKGKVSKAIQDKLDSLGIKLNSTLASKIRNSTEDIVLTAIAALEEQRQNRVIKRPGAWLAQAIEGGWQPNQPIGENHSVDFFAQWYDLARENGIVIGSRKDDDGTIWVQDNTSDWVIFEEFSSKWTLDHLRSRAKK